MFKVFHFCSKNREETESKFNNLHEAIDHAIQFDGYIEGICGYNGGYQQSTLDYIGLNKKNVSTKWCVNIEINDRTNPISIYSVIKNSLEEAISFKEGTKFGIDFSNRDKDKEIEYEIKIFHYDTKLEYQN